MELLVLMAIVLAGSILESIVTSFRRAPRSVHQDTYDETRIEARYLGLQNEGAKAA